MSIDFNQVLQDIDKSTLENIKVKELQNEPMEVIAVDMAIESLAKKLMNYCMTELDVLVKRDGTVLYLDKVTERDVEKIEKKVKSLEMMHGIGLGATKINRTVAKGIHTGFSAVVPAAKVTSSLVAATLKGAGFAGVKSASVFANSMSDSLRQSKREIEADEDIQRTWSGIKTRLTAFRTKKKKKNTYASITSMPKDGAEEN